MSQGVNSEIKNPVCLVYQTSSGPFMSTEPSAWASIGASRDPQKNYPFVVSNAHTLKKMKFYSLQNFKQHFISPESGTSGFQNKNGVPQCIKLLDILLSEGIAFVWATCIKGFFK